MNTADLLAHSNILVESAITTRRQLRNLIDCADSIYDWLRANNLYPMEMGFRPLFNDTGFQVVYEFHSEDLLTFARVEKEFWQYVDSLIAIDHITRTYVSSNQPFASVEMDEYVWKVVVTPDTDAMGGRIPDHNFWESAAIAEDSLKDERRRDLHLQRIADAREALDLKHEDHGAGFVITLPHGG